MSTTRSLFDSLTQQASRLFGQDSPLPKAEIESQFKALLQGALSKLDVVSRDEFDAQMAVLARTRARLEALEARLTELEKPLTAEVKPPVTPATDVAPAD
ncbi:BMFP domain-containing protein YqiC [Pseudomonas sp. SORGH_AS199]|jgi:BMFP domain-containing protein YqiC|uniref:accessory factor UbiK family protein n=1 Tax=Pseudomonas TaxID=286 RepID=UPI0025553F59|nr:MULTISPECIES: accessory factor UbiK family protein [Pseudomonas]MDK8262710.1 accessory factor UbiK family protein [Pseudomonas oryzihabitans]MDR6227820.1 BMFP domain-containing protein YqiC [Pseudomonas sp. SORGH_AS_0199]